MESYYGECLCGEIKFKVENIGSKMSHCHCSMCRKFHGAAFATYGEAKLDDFYWLAGEELLHTYLAENKTRRKFCGQCGSSLIFQSAKGEKNVVEFALATLQTASDLEPDAHIFTSTQVEWLTLADTLPKFQNERE